MSPATKLRDGAQNLWLMFTAIWATCIINFIEMGSVDAAEYRQIIDYFD